MSTGRALIDVQNRKLTMRVNDQHVTLSVFNLVKYPADDVEKCSPFRLADDLLSEELQTEA